MERAAGCGSFIATAQLGGNQGSPSTDTTQQLLKTLGVYTWHSTHTPRKSVLFFTG